MSCLFCDQTPETVNAREKLAAIAKLLNCSLISVIMGVQSLLTENAYLKMSQESLVRDRDQWRSEAEYAQRYAYARYRDERMLPDKYCSVPFTAQYSDSKPTAVAVPFVVDPLIAGLDAMPKGKK